MADLGLRQALDRIQPEWSDQRTSNAYTGLGRKRLRRAATRATAAGLGAVALLLVAYRWRQAPAAETARQEQRAPAANRAPLAEEAIAPAARHRVVNLRDGTSVSSSAEAELTIVEDSQKAAVVRVDSGRHEFARSDDSRRALTVTSGDLHIEVHSTAFAVAHFDAAAEVWAYNGYLRLEWNGEVRELREGEHATFPTGTANQGGGSKRLGDPSAPQTDRADQPAPLQRRDVDALLREADEARANGQPRAAVAPLRALLARYPDDARAPLAAFTLGRVLLDDLSQPTSAARAFHRARQLAPRGALAEDALAREVEAWAAAGDDRRARDRAELYLERYPDGHRARTVRQYASP